MGTLTYAAVIVTRDRAEALQLSLPLLLAQSRRPDQVIVVDSSNDHAPIRQIVEEHARVSGVAIRFIESTPGTPLQRNRGLAEVETDVVLFPDDDSLLLPGTMEHIMRIYELDTEGIVGGVCSAEAQTAPHDILATAEESYRMTPADRLKRHFGRLRRWIESRLFPNPFFYFAKKRYRTLPVPAWLAKENAVLVEWMTGFRMSFRTNVVRAVKFDETLGRYALFEDVDASFQVLKTHVLVGSRKAQIYHHKAPSPRGGGRELGATQILNRAYVLAKGPDIDARLTIEIRRYALYKIFLYMLRPYSNFGRARFAGAFAAYCALPQLLAATPDELTEVYLELLEKCLSPT